MTESDSMGDLKQQLTRLSKEIDLTFKAIDKYGYNIQGVGGLDYTLRTLKGQIRGISGKSQ